MDCFTIGARFLYPLTISSALSLYNGFIIMLREEDIKGSIIYITTSRSITSSYRYYIQWPSIRETIKYINAVSLSDSENRVYYIRYLYLIIFRNILLSILLLRYLYIDALEETSSILWLWQTDFLRNSALSRYTYQRLKIQYRLLLSTYRGKKDFYSRLFQTAVYNLLLTFRKCFADAQVLTRNSLLYSTQRLTGKRKL